MRILSIFLVLLLCVSLGACGGGEPEVASISQVQITAGKIEAAMTPAEISVEVTIDGEPVPCKVELTCFTETGYYVMEADEAVPEDFFGRLDVYYSLPKGVDLDGVEVAMECDGGEYDGTGSVSDDENGCVVAWSHAIYGTEPAAIPQVQITAGKIETGMTPAEISVEVTIDGEPVSCKVELTCFTETGYYVMEADEAVPENFFGRLDVYYSLPEGVDLDGVEVAMECDGGEYDGTGSVSSDENGCVVAWSHALYGTEPEPATEPETTPETTQQTVPETVPQTQPVHTHSWVEDSGKSAPVGCAFDGYTTYVCSCGESWRQTISALGHDYGEASTTPATCTQPGHSTTICKRCGDGLINDLPATGHSWSEWVYENGRLHKHTCSQCGAEEEANHNVPSGTVKCTDCGQDIIN